MAAAVRPRSPQAAASNVAPAAPAAKRRRETSLRADLSDMFTSNRRDEDTAAAEPS
jgi:hypothetical protein